MPTPRGGRCCEPRGASPSVATLLEMPRRPPRVMPRRLSVNLVGSRASCGRALSRGGGRRRARKPHQEAALTSTVTRTRTSYIAEAYLIFKTHMCRFLRPCRIFPSRRISSSTSKPLPLPVQVHMLNGGKTHTASLGIPSDASSACSQCWVGRSASRCAQCR